MAECLSHDIFTEGGTWDQLRANVKEAVSAYLFDQPKPTGIRLHLVRRGSSQTAVEECLSGMP